MRHRNGGAPDYTNLGDSTVRRLSAKAVMLEFTVPALGTRWVPFSQLAPESLAKCNIGGNMTHTRVTKWWVDQTVKHRKAAK